MSQDDATQDTTPAPNAGPRPISVDDVQRLIGALTLELELLRRENAALRAQVPPA